MEPQDLTPEELQQWQAVRQALLQAEEDDPGFWDKAKAVASDIGGGLAESHKAVGRGVIEAINETSDTTFSLAKWLNDNVIDLGHIKFGSDAESGTPFDDRAGFGIGGVVSWAPGMPEQNNLRVPESLTPDAAQTATGKFIQGTAQFVTGMAMAGRYLKAAGMPAAHTAKGVIAQGMLKGAITDATAFDPHEERLANLIEQNTDFARPVTEFLAARPDDSEAEGRFKNALEGLLLGAPIEGLFHAVRAIKFKRMGKEREALEALEEVEKAEASAQTKSAEEAPKTDPESAATAPKGEGATKDPEQLELDLGDEFQDTFTGQRGKNGKLEPEDLKPDIPSKNGKEPFKDITPFVKVTDEDLIELEKLIADELDFGQGRNLSGIRTDLIETDEHINQRISAVARAYADKMRQAIGGNADGVRTWEATRRNADKFAELIGEDPRILFQRMRALHKETFMANAEMLAYRDVMATVNNKLTEAAQAIANPRYDYSKGKFKSVAEARQEFARNYEILANVQLMYKGLQTNFARTMNSMKQVAKAKNGLLDGADPEAMWKGGPRQMEKLARRIVANEGNLKANLKETRPGFVNKFLSVTNEFWINSLLSGLKTHAANTISGVLNTAYLPLERIAAGALRGDTAEMREAAEHYVGMVMSAREALVLARKALKAGDPILDPTHGGTEYRSAISAENLNITDPNVAWVVNGIGNLVRIPSRLLAAEDEFIKQLNYRGAVRAEAWREARELGLKGKDFADYVAKKLDEAVDEMGRATNEKALGFAREATFTQDLGGQQVWRQGGRTIGETLQGIASAHPSLRLIMPFIRTPTNIFRFVHNRTPFLNMLRKQYAMDFLGKNGAEAAAKARAQFLTGSLLYTAAISMAASGEITGAGPKDRDIRRALMDTGWRPYSIRMEKEDGSVEYVSYQRMDPFGMFLGLVADFTEVAGAHPERELEETALAMTAALARNLNNKSYLTGIVNFLGALSEPERKVEFFAQGMAAGFVPNFLSQQINQDPHFREVRSIVDAMRRKTPGFSDDLDPQRNVLGEKQYIPPSLGPDWLSPVTTGIHKKGAQPLTDEWKRTPQSDVYDELARQMFIHNSAIRPIPTKYEGVDLTKHRSPVTGFTAHDRLQELVGTIKIHGKTLKEQLSELINSKDYKERLSDGDYDLNGSRIDVIRSVIQAYRQVAFEHLAREIPAVYWERIEAARKAALIKVQPQDRPDPLTFSVQPNNTVPNPSN